MIKDVLAIKKILGFRGVLDESASSQRQFAVGSHALCAVLCLLTNAT